MPSANASDRATVPCLGNKRIVHAKPVASSKSEESLSSVSWDVLSSESERRTPVFWEFVVSSATNPEQMIAM